MKKACQRQVAYGKGNTQATYFRWLFNIFQDFNFGKLKKLQNYLGRFETILRAEVKETRQKKANTTNLLILPINHFGSESGT